MQQQDPFDPVDNKEMLAQMAQFSSLAGSTTSIPPFSRFRRSSTRSRPPSRPSDEQEYL
jgi:flagellar hook assembly protein FlgD